MAIKVKGSFSAAELPEAGNLRLNLLVELTGDAPSPRVHRGSQRERKPGPKRKLEMPVLVDEIGNRGSEGAARPLG